MFIIHVNRNHVCLVPMSEPEEMLEHVLFGCDVLGSDGSAEWRNAYFVDQQVLVPVVGIVEEQFREFHHDNLRCFVSQEVELAHSNFSLAFHQSYLFWNLVEEDHLFEEKVEFIWGQRHKQRVDQDAKEISQKRGGKEWTVDVHSEFLDVVRKSVQTQVVLLRSCLLVVRFKVACEQLSVFLVLYHVLVKDPLFGIKISGELILDVNFPFIVLEFPQLFQVQTCQFEDQPAIVMRMQDSVLLNSRQFLPINNDLLDFLWDLRPSREVVSVLRIEKTKDQFICF